MPRAFLYADDLVVFVAPNAADLHCLKDILALFAGALGLITNMDKCLASPPIRCSEDDLMIVQQAFPCRIAPFPLQVPGGINFQTGRAKRAGTGPVRKSTALARYGPASAVPVPGPARSRARA